MATLPASFAMSTTAHDLDDSSTADDIGRLRAALQLPEFDYVGLGMRAEMLRALRRWPLLDELDRSDALPTTHDRQEVAA
ncbi:cellulose biosynthesis protein BcsR [Aromatoleum bremense]|nr:cellulose biosynthesis protein BcsR [Aromatoleum bremense]